MLEIKELYARTDEKEILRGFSLTVKPGEVHAVMGPNGAGKSTFAKVLVGHPAYEVTGGEMRFNGHDLLELEPEERAHLGLFMSFQHPLEIAGVTNVEFLQAAYNATRKAQGLTPLSDEVFLALLEEKMALMGIKEEFKSRNLNEGFSGGEKKRNEMLQMAVLEPKLAILDEIDSGLDIDAMRIVAEGINRLRTKENAFILITHYQRLLDFVKPDFVHVAMDGKVARVGDASLALELEQAGYGCC